MDLPSIDAAADEVFFVAGMDKDSHEADWARVRDSLAAKMATLSHLGLSLDRVRKFHAHKILLVAELNGEYGRTH